MTVDALITRAHLAPAITDPQLMSAIRRHFGAPTIDLAATAADTVAPDFITPEEDSLQADWPQRIGSGLGYCNPTSGDLLPWVRKCFEANRRILLLIPLSMDADWWWLYVQGVARVHVLSPRLTYNGLPIPMCIVEYGSDSGLLRWYWTQ